MQHPCHTSLGKRDRDARIQNTIDDPLFLPPIDIVIPSPDIPPYFHVPKFFPPDDVLEILLVNSTLGSSAEGQGITPFAKEEIRPEGYIPKFFSTEITSENFPPVSSSGKFLGDCYVPEIFMSQNSLEIPAESRGGE